MTTGRPGDGASGPSANIEELIGDPDPERSQAAMKAMLGMGEIDIAEVRRAADEA